MCTCTCKLYKISLKSMKCKHVILWFVYVVIFKILCLDHRSSDAVYIGLHVPKRKHRRKRHKHRRVEGDKTQSSQPEIFKDGKS